MQSPGINKIPAILSSIVFGGVLAGTSLQAQDVMKVQKGAAITVQTGADMIIQGGVALENGSTLLNNGTIYLKQAGEKGAANWMDNTTVAYHHGTGRVVFNGTGGHTVSSENTFERIEIDAAGHLNLASDIKAKNWYLVKGRINTGAYKMIALNNSPLAVEAAPGNADFSNSWVNGTLRRYMTPDAVNSYVFPVGDDAKVNLAVMDNLASNPLNNLSYVDASFAAKPLITGQENFTINKAGVWYLKPDVMPSSGNYDLLLYLNGFSGLTDNAFEILNRTTTSWAIPAGSVLPVNYQPGRTVSSGFARRNHISNFGQNGIGMQKTGFATQPTSLKDRNESRVTVLLYPNPSNGQFSIRLEGTDRSMDAVITDMRGKVIRQLRLTNNNAINISGLSAGTYLVSIPDLYGTGEVFSEKVVVVK